MARAQLTFLVYLSLIRCTPEDIAELVGRSKTRNAASGLTGVLIHDGRHFLQLLEGPWSATAETLLRIAGDPRHNEMTILVREPTEIRQFSNWSLERLEYPREDAALYDRIFPIFNLSHPDRGSRLRQFALDLESALLR